MYLTDYHLHSEYSFDGHEKLEVICDKAIQMGLQEIAITDHMDLYTDKPYEYILDFAKEYPELQSIREKYMDRLKVKIGIELGQPQVNKEEAKRFLQDYNLDFIIGSIHNMENDIDVGDYNFRELDCNKVYRTYLDWLMDLAINYDYDVIGHVTYPLRYMAKMDIYLDVSIFEDQVRALYEAVIRRGKGIELNASGLYQAIKETMPSFPMIKWYKECGGEIITVGSDSHYAVHIGEPILKGMDLLRAAGFKYITTFENRKPIFNNIEI